MQGVLFRGGHASRGHLSANFPARNARIGIVRRAAAHAGVAESLAKYGSIGVTESALTAYSVSAYIFNVP